MEHETLKKIKGWKHEKEFDTQTLISDIGPLSEGDTPDNSGTDKKSDDTRKAMDLKTITDAESRISDDTVTQVYEPRPLTPDDDIYEDIIEQFASEPTKPKYWFEEFGDYWSCSCGHINKGDTCMSCGLQRDLLRSLFILHKPADSPGKLNKKLSKAAKEQADKEKQVLTDKENRRKQREAAGDDGLSVVPIEVDMQEETAPQEEIIQDDTDAFVPQEEPVTEDDTFPENHVIQEENAAAEGHQSLVPAVINKNTKFRDSAFKKKIIAAIAACLVLIGGGLFVIYHYLAAPAMQYEDAMKLQKEGKYEKAIEKYEALGDYKDCEDRIWQCYCSIGDEYFAAGEFTKAIDTYNIAIKLKDDKKLHNKIWQCYIGIGDKYFEAGKFKKAIDTYNTAIDLKDDETIHDKIWQCYIGIGDKYLAEGKYDEALSTYATAAGIKDNETIQGKINQAKFEYVKAYQADRTAKVEEYMNDLMAVKFSGIKDIYDSYYAWHVNIIANTSAEDYSNDVSTVSRKDTVYFHSMLSGGEPSEQISVYYEISWPDGDSQIYNLNSTWVAGSKITARFQYPIPLFGKEGKLTFKLYDRSTNELLGSDSVTFKN